MQLESLSIHVKVWSKPNYADEDDNTPEAPWCVFHSQQEHVQFLSDKWYIEELSCQITSNNHKELPLERELKTNHLLIDDKALSPPKVTSEFTAA